MKLTDFERRRTIKDLKRVNMEIKYFGDESKYIVYVLFDDADMVKLLGFLVCVAALWGVLSWLVK